MLMNRLGHTHMLIFFVYIWMALNLVLKIEIIYMISYFDEPSSQVHLEWIPAKLQHWRNYVLKDVKCKICNCLNINSMIPIDKWVHTIKVIFRCHITVLEVTLWGCQNTHYLYFILWHDTDCALNTE